VTEDGLIDGAALQAAPEEEQGNGGEEEIGGPGCERGREVTGIPEGEKDLGTEEHGSDEQGCHGHSACGAATAEDDAERGGEKDDHQANPRLRPAVMPLGEVRPARRPFISPVLLEPASELGDPEVIFLQSRGDDLPGGFGKIVDEIGIGQIVTPGLQEDYLGIPELRSWLQQYGGDEWAPRRSYLTQWHYRWSQPWICLVVVLLSAPLGIVFSRRGTAGGVAMAALLIGAMLLCSKIFLTLGDAGHLSPPLAAWATNLLFTSIALLLFWRRLQGRPIYQTILSHTPLGNGD
jgi:hypothetical protein